MIDALRELLSPWYLYIKAIHVFAMMAWVWSTSVAYAFYLVPIFKAWRRNPGDPDIVRARNWAIERFDEGATYEHVAFPLILVSGPLLYIAGGWNTGVGWLMLKLLIVFGIFLPIEVMDYYLSHGPWGKLRLRLAGDPVAYETAIHRHWWFLLVTSPTVMIFAFAIVFLAVVRPI
ncbi:MAG: hypothetical protein U1F11_01295 [Steroidobacteraceae bacterium]